MRSLERKGKSVDEAVKLALEELGVGLDDVVIEVLEEPTRGILGIIGNKPAVVRVDVKNRPEKLAREKLKALLDGMKINYEIDRVDFQDGVVRINITGKDMGLLIGRKGETLNAVQFILGLMVNRELDERVRVILDVEDYRTPFQATRTPPIFRKGSPHSNIVGRPATARQVTMSNWFR
jgi:spoIIIJ-associated protein